MIFHHEILRGGQPEALRLLTPFVTSRGFYLGGGTALALLVGHRLSVDFDWFTGERLGDPLRLAVELREAEIPFETTSMERGTLHGTISGVRISFLEYRYPFIRSTVSATEFGIEIASPEDLACMKLSAVAQRGSRKDFVDIFVLERNWFRLEDMIGFYREKYSVSDIAHLLYGLSYFDDADSEPMPVCLWDIEWNQVKRSIKEWVKSASTLKSGQLSTSTKEPPHAG